jgi:hypothetical protein
VFLRQSATQLASVSGHQEGRGAAAYLTALTGEETTSMQPSNFFAQDVLYTPFFELK